MASDISTSLIEQINNAIENKSPLVISGGGSKAFYGNRVEGETLSTAKHTGIIEYQPSELVVTVRSGTRLSELEAELAAKNQMLAFEPPQHSKDSTIGGVIACGLSGPRRVACGAARDFVLGATIINGRGEKLRFGGQVMKNVAGYDAARLMTGAQGTLGVLLDVSLKVLPLNETEVSLKIQTHLDNAVSSLRTWVKNGLPLTASCYVDNSLYLRLGSTHSAVKKAVQDTGKHYSADEIDSAFWQTIKNQTHPFFSDNENLWRCSHQNTTAFYENINKQLVEWHGALRWIHSEGNMHTIAAEHGGHASRYPLQAAPVDDIFQPLPEALLHLQRNLKRAFDPDGLLNPGRLYRAL
ncbi:MAG TPA: glycolate oxidase subunit GlcE [Gammaproteobacteria bacterium]|nr:glycolate oxidase subunit GlcE [Gammaproteobacteria bacterium]